MIPGVTLEQLRTLRAVAEAGSFSAAARRLGRVQAAVSQSVDRLEAQLGLKLFDRTARTPTLTRHGEAVAAAAARVHDEVGALDELVASLKRGEPTTLAIAVDAIFPTAALVAFATEFACAHPTVELQLFTETLAAVTALVRDKRAALGVAGEDADLGGLVRRRIAEIKLVPVAAPTHPLGQLPGSLDAAALGRAVQIVLSERVRADDGPSPDRGVLSSRTWRVVDLATKHALIAAGLGWGHLPEPTVRGDVRAGRLVELRLDAWGGDPPRRGLYLVHRRGAVLDPVAESAAARLVELCRGAVDHGG